MIPICEHFGFNAIPFLKAPQKPFLSPIFAKQIELISTAFSTRQIAVVTGASGSGKSCLLRYAVDRLEPSSHRVISCELANPAKKGLYQLLATKCGIKPSFYADDTKLQLMEFFDNENRQGRFNCLILDEIHSVSIPMLTEIRNFYDEAGNFSMVLSGLPDIFTHKLNLTVNLPMKRRISLRVDTEGISLAETKTYVQHHLDAVKAKNQVFDELCFPDIHSLSNGFMGRIDQLCAAALFEAFLNQFSIIDRSIIQACADKLHY